MGPEYGHSQLPDGEWTWDSRVRAGVSIPYPLLSDEDFEEFQRRWWEQANTPAAIARHQRREMRRLLPRRARFRLWLAKHLTFAGCRLIDHGHSGAAERLWRIAGRLD